MVGGSTIVQLSQSPRIHLMHDLHPLQVPHAHRASLLDAPANPFVVTVDVTFTIVNTTGGVYPQWVYMRANNPLYFDPLKSQLPSGLTGLQFTLTSCLRKSDNFSVVVPDNAWTTDRSVS
jgi:hypothetical protein